MQLPACGCWAGPCWPAESGRGDHDARQAVPPGLRSGGGRADHLPAGQRCAAVRAAAVSAGCHRLPEPVRPVLCRGIRTHGGADAPGGRGGGPAPQAADHGGAGLLHLRPGGPDGAGPGASAPGAGAGGGHDAAVRDLRGVSAGGAGQHASAVPAGPAGGRQRRHQPGQRPVRLAGTAAGEPGLRRLRRDAGAGRGLRLLFRLGGDGAVHPHPPHAAAHGDRHLADCPGRSGGERPFPPAGAACDPEVHRPGLRLQSAVERQTRPPWRRAAWPGGWRRACWAPG